MIIVTVNGVLVEECYEDITLKSKCEEVAEMYCLPSSEEKGLIEQGEVTTFNGYYIEVYEVES